MGIRPVVTSKCPEKLRIKLAAVEMFNSRQLLYQARNFAKKRPIRVMASRNSIGAGRNTTRK